MFADRTHAFIVSEALLSVNTILNFTIYRLRESGCPDKECQMLAKQTGKILGITLFTILEAIWRKYPDLRPLEFEKPL